MAGRWARWREGFRHRPAANGLYRVAVAVVGLVVFVIGILAIPYPGPGWAVLFIGLGILATEFEWARRWLAVVRRHYDSARAWLNSQPLWVRALVTTLIFGVAVAALWLTGVFGWVAGLFGVTSPWL
jgi:uncharacterized protein (TIGR02611 family)